MRWIRTAWGPGRSSIPRGVIGVFLAPLVAVLILPTPLFVVSLVEHWGADPITPGAAAMQSIVLVAAYLIGLAIAVCVGVPLWILLRHHRRESGAAYLVAGLLAGMAVGVRLHLFSAGLLSPSQLLALAMCLAAGGGAAIGFWLVARDPLHLAHPPAAKPQEEPAYVAEWREYGRRAAEARRLAAEAETPQQMHDYLIEAEQWQAKCDAALPVPPNPPVIPGDQRSPPA